tara:strand:+ start:2201 stop:2476 length:276 start_codon:yes stop_codon:yes gene_type:complete
MDINTIVKQGDTLVSCEIGEQIALLNVESGNYHSFNEVASRIWQLIQVPTPIGQVCDVLSSEYKIDPAQCEKEVVSFLGKLKGESLVSVQI